MKKLLLILALFSTSVSFFSQNWLDVGIKGGWGPTFLFNQSIFDDGSYNHQISTRGTFGAKLGFNFNPNHEITFDFMVGGLNQDFKFNVSDSGTIGTQEFGSNIKYSSFDFLLMYRNNNEGKYFEIGPIISNLRSVNKTVEGVDDINFDITKVNKIQSGIALGFGAYFMGTDNFGITGGVRISYMASDLISEAGKSNNYPTGKPYDTYKATHPLLVQLVFEANLDFAYLAKANCGRRKILMF